MHITHAHSLLLGSWADSAPPQRTTPPRHRTTTDDRRTGTARRCSALHAHTTRRETRPTDGEKMTPTGRTTSAEIFTDTADTRHTAVGKIRTGE